MSFFFFCLVKSYFVGVVFCLVTAQILQDLWDSINNNDYFSFEGLVDVFKQVACSHFISRHEVISCK